MFRLTPPTTGTFTLSVAAMALGMILHLDLLAVPELDPYAFWLVAGGGALLTLGVLFRKI
ncbi:MAG: hypothetical protein ACRDVM_01100 [Acidimicrobiia bacterium]